MKTIPNGSRAGLSLLELLVVITIIGILVALLLPAIQQVRVTAARMKTANQMKQISLAFHSYASVEDGRVPSADGKGNAVPHGAFQLILPYIDYNISSVPGSPLSAPIIYRNPNDPTYLVTTIGDDQGSSSFSLNAIAHRSGMTLNRITDGTSNTYSITERYASCGKFTAIWSLTTSDAYIIVGGVLVLQPYVDKGVRRSTFADAHFRDVVPVADPINRTANPSVPGLTFQVKPLGIDDCDSRIPQAPLTGSLLVAYFDGSVRGVRPSIIPSAFWGQVTPDGGEVAGD